jgi:hypothetical protein
MEEPVQTRTVSQPRWTTIFDSLSRIYDGAHASLEVLSADLGAQFEIEDQPLRGISCDDTGIEVHFLTRRGEHLAHRIPDAKRVQIEENAAGLLVAVEIEGDGSDRVIVRFSSPASMKLLSSGEA